MARARPDARNPSLTHIQAYVSSPSQVIVASHLGILCLHETAVEQGGVAIEEDGVSIISIPYYASKRVCMVKVSLMNGCNDGSRTKGVLSTGSLRLFAATASLTFRLALFDVFIVRTYVCFHDLRICVWPVTCEG